MPEIDTISEPPAKIRLADVGIVFRPRDREPVVAVRDFTFDVPEGSIVTIVGPSGCGKSTILNIVSGLMPPSRGKVEVDGRPVTGIRHDVGYMFARDGMMPWRTAIENVAFGLEVRGIANRNEIAREWLTRSPRSVAVRAASCSLDTPTRCRSTRRSGSPIRSRSPRVTTSCTGSLPP